MITGRAISPNLCTMTFGTPCTWWIRGLLSFWNKGQFQYDQCHVNVSNGNLGERQFELQLSLAQESVTNRNLSRLPLKAPITSTPGLKRSKKHRPIAESSLLLRSYESISKCNALFSPAFILSQSFSNPFRFKYNKKIGIHPNCLTF